MNYKMFFGGACWAGISTKINTVLVRAKKLCGASLHRPLLLLQLWGSFIDA
jgi:hypothetical protein